MYLPTKSKGTLRRSCTMNNFIPSQCQWAWFNKHELSNAINTIKRLVDGKSTAISADAEKHTDNVQECFMIKNKSWRNYICNKYNSINEGRANLHPTLYCMSKHFPLKYEMRLVCSHLQDCILLSVVLNFLAGAMRQNNEMNRIKTWQKK